MPVSARSEKQASLQSYIFQIFFSFFFFKGPKQSEGEGIEAICLHCKSS